MEECAIGIVISSQGFELLLVLHTCPLPNFLFMIHFLLFRYKLIF